MDRRLTVRQFHGHRGFSEICESWHELMRSISLQFFYHHPAWFQAYFDRPDVRGDMYFRCAYQDDRLVGVLPLYFVRSFAGVIRTARMPDYDGLYMPDLAVSDDVCLSSVWSAMTSPDARALDSKWDVFLANGVLEESTAARCLALADNDIVTSSIEGRCAVLDVSSYDEVVRQFKRKFRGNLNNAKRRIQLEPDVHFLSISEPDELLPAFEEFVQLELSGWKGRRELRDEYPAPAAIGLKQSKYLFYRNIVREFGRVDAIRIILLKVGGRAIGAQICIHLNAFCFVLKTAFDEAYRKYSPGHLVLDFMYRQLADAGRIKHICLITDYHWFRYWNPRYLNYVRIKSFRKSLKGRVISAAYNVKRR